MDYINLKFKLGFYDFSNIEISVLTSVKLVKHRYEQREIMSE